MQFCFLHLHVYVKGERYHLQNIGLLIVRAATKDITVVPLSFFQPNKKKWDIFSPITLEYETTRNSLLAEMETWASYDRQLEHARRQYRDAFRRYKEGIANYIELLDARTQVTNVELQQSVAMYNVLIKKAELERAIAGYPLP